MNRFLRIFIGISIVLLTLSVTAFSCNKVAGDKSNSNNNSGNNSGGTGGGGGDGTGGTGSGGTGNTFPTATGTIEIKINDNTKAKLTTKTDGNDTILINANALIGLGIALGPSTGLPEFFSQPSANIGGNVFDLTITGGGAGNATAGLVLVSTGDLANITNFSTETGAIRPPYASGMLVEQPATVNIVGNAVNTFAPAGFRFWGGFTDQAQPTSSIAGTAPSTDPGTAPFSFTDNAGGGVARQPALACRSVITSISSADPTSATRATPDKLLTGGQTSKCFMATRGVFQDAAALKTWFDAAAAATHWKKSFYISVAGIRTDSKQLKDVIKNFQGADDNAKVAAFMDGLTTAEMEQLARDNIYAYKKILVKIVTKADFDNAPYLNGVVPFPAPTATIEAHNFNGAKLTTKTGGIDTILINADALKKATDGLAAGGTIKDVAEVGAVNIIGRSHFFHLRFNDLNTGPGQDGLILVSTGDLASITNFSTPAPGTVPAYNSGIYVEGPINVTDPNTDIYRPSGLNFWGIFADQTAPTANNPNTAPFAFTANTAGGAARQPILSCRANASDIPTVAHAVPNGSLGVSYWSECYMLARSKFENDADLTTWFAAATANPTTFKTSFYISVAGIRADRKNLGEILRGFPQATDQAKVDAFMDGLTTAEMELLARNNRYAYKKFLIKVVPKAEYDAAP